MTSSLNFFLSLDLKSNTLPLNHGFAATRKSCAFTLNLDQSRLRRLLLLFPLLSLFGIRCGAEIGIADVAMYRIWFWGVVMRIAVMTMFWPEKLVDARLAENMTAGDSEHSFCII